MGTDDKVDDKINGKLLEAAVKLVEAANKGIDEALPGKIAGIVKLHAALGVASGFIPVPGADMVAGIAAIWGMYFRINKELDLPFGDNVIKSVASGVGTNLMAYTGIIAVGSALKFIPGLGTLAAVAIISAASYALTLASGYVYIKVLTALLGRKSAGDITESDWMSAINEVLSNKQDVQSFVGEAKKAYKNVDGVRAATPSDMPRPWTAPAAQPVGGADLLQRVESARIHALINLMLADQNAAPEEIAYIRELIDAAELPEVDRQALRHALTTGKRVRVDYSALNESPEGRAGLLSSMVALAKRDGVVHFAERLYVNQVSRQLGFSEADVNAAFDAEIPTPNVQLTPAQIPWSTQARVKDPEFGIDVDVTMQGCVTVLGVWPEAVAWVSEQTGRLAIGTISRSTTSLALAWSYAEDLAVRMQDELDILLRPHQMRALSVENVEVQLAPESMAALERASR